MSSAVSFEIRSFSRLRSHAACCWIRASVRDGSAASRARRARSSSGGIRHFEYASTSDVKYEKRWCVGLRKSNWGLRASRFAIPVRKVRPLRATNCAVSWITSRSSGCAPGGFGTVCIGRAGSSGVTLGAFFFFDAATVASADTCPAPGAATAAAGAAPAAGASVVVPPSSCTLAT